MVCIRYVGVSNTSGVVSKVIVKAKMYAISSDTHQWGSGTWYPLDVAPGDETEHIIAQACKMAGKTSTPMQIMCYEKK